MQTCDQPINEELSRTYFQVDMKTHAKTKGMWSGSMVKSPNLEFLFEDGMFKKRNISYPYALYKGVDEILVNAIDQWIKTSDGPTKFAVTKINITFASDGYISIFNDGNGIPVDIVKNVKGEAIYVPQLISTEFLAGSNNSSDDTRISGGTNGLGIKLTSNNSKHFILETVDLISKKHYVQESHNRLETTDPPTITLLKNLPLSNSHKKGGTTFKFLPDYSIYKINIAEDYDELNTLFKTRAIHTAAHTGIPVTYNGINIPVPDMKKFAALFMPEDQFVYTKIKQTHSWDVVVGLTGGMGFDSLSIVNGVLVKTGSHINYIRDMVVAGVKVRTERTLKKYREYKKSMVQNNLFIMISGNIPNPSFDSQTKTNINDSPSKYKGYVLKKNIIDKIWKILEPCIIEQFLTNPLKEKPTRKQSTVGIKKYKKAKFAGTNKSKKCTLLICEGDSAESMTRTSLTSKKVNMNYDYFGTFNIGGVPMNSRTKSVTQGTLPNRNVLRQKQLVDNERLTSMEKVLNLDHGERKKI